MDKNYMNTKIYTEERARNTLHWVCGYNLEDLEHSDRPDIQDYRNSYGIEVVQDVIQKDQETTYHLNEVYYTPYSELCSKKKKVFEKNQVKLTIEENQIKGALLGDRENTPGHLVNTILKKVDLLNKGGYQFFKTYGLYVFVNTVCIDVMFDSYVKQVIEEVSEYQSKQKKKFDVLYLDQGYTLCICDLNNNTFKRNKIDSSMHKIINKASMHSEFI